MHTLRNRSLKEVLVWTRKDIYYLVLIAAIPTTLYHTFHWKWLSIPWLPIALIGTAVAFVIGFKNNASYDRAWEARKIWGGIVNISRTWATMVKDYVTDIHSKEAVSEEKLHAIHLKLVNRHLAWLAALRHQLREPRQWEAMQQGYNIEFRQHKYQIAEYETSLFDTLKPYLSDEEHKKIMKKTNKAANLLAMQSAHLKELYRAGLIEDFRHMELENIIKEQFNLEGASERIKNFPYPRQFSTMNHWYIRIFSLLIPFGMLQEFEKMGAEFVWLTIPFSVLVSWVFSTMEKIGEASENPFEGSANDTPITAMSKGIEIDLLEIIDHEHELKPIKEVNGILT